MTTLEEVMRNAYFDDMGDEPQTPKEIAQVDVELTARDSWLAAQKLSRLRNDPIAKPAFTPRVEAELWSAYNELGALLTCIRIDNGEEPLPRHSPKLRVISNG